MSSSKGDVTFEVHILQNGRWEVHAGYPADGQGQAIKDAKALEAISTISGVKVVREERDAATGGAKDNNIYASKNLKDEQPKGKQEAKKTKAGGGGKPAKTARTAKKKSKPTGKNQAMKAGKDIPQPIEKFDPDATPEKQFSLFGIFIKLLLVVLFGAIIASLVTGLASIWLKDSPFRTNTQSNIIFGLFVGTFALSVFSMSMSFLKKAKLKTSAPAPAKPVEPVEPVQPEPKPEKKSALAGIDAIDEIGGDAKDKDEEDEEDEDTEEKEEFDEEFDEEEEEDTYDPFAEEEAKQAEDLGDEIGADIGLEEPWVAKQTEFIMKYLTTSLEQAGVDSSKLDNFNKFGISLFMAGACESLSQQRNLDANTMSKVLSAPVKLMGFKKNDTEGFGDKVQSYLLIDSRYMKIFQAGRSSMNAYLEGDPGCLMKLSSALTEWNQPKTSSDVKTGPVTVLFTDIAGSTNMTQTLGDAVAQQIVRAHNRLVRDALSKFSGKEIKHTGDGIMASFTTTSNGVEAAADMQMATIKHNEVNPDLPLGLKIGLNAGEPIEEDDDLFGTTVQLAARIVDKARAGEVFLSETVYGICSGKSYRFASRGAFDFKGFDSKITIYELAWNDTAPAPSPKPAAEEAPAAENEPEPESQGDAEEADEAPAAESDATAETEPTAENESPSPDDAEQTPDR